MVQLAGRACLTVERRGAEQAPPVFMARTPHPPAPSPIKREGEQNLWTPRPATQLQRGARGEVLSPLFANR